MSNVVTIRSLSSECPVRNPNLHNHELVCKMITVMLCNRPIILPKSMKMLLFVLVLYLHFIKPCEQREPILVWAQLLVLVLQSCHLPLHQGSHHDVVTIMMSLSHYYLSFIYIRGFSAGMLNILSQSLCIGFLPPYKKSNHV